MNVNLKQGDLLYRQKGIFGHAGVYLGGLMVFHHSPSGSVVTSFADYSEGKEVHVVKTGKHNREELVSALEAILTSGNSYNPFTNNCEHLANTLLFGRKFSGQVQAGLISAAIGGFLSWKTGKGHPLVVALAAGAIGCIGVNSLRKTDKKVVAM